MFSLVPVCLKGEGYYPMMHWDKQEWGAPPFCEKDQSERRPPPPPSFWLEGSDQDPLPSFW